MIYLYLNIWSLLRFNNYHPDIKGTSNIIPRASVSFIYVTEKMFCTFQSDP